VTSASPTVRRRELGARLRALRLESGLTVEDVAGRMEVSPAKISRIETAARGVSIADVRFLCDLYEVSPEERDRLLALTGGGRRGGASRRLGRDVRRPRDAAVAIQQ
jgi:transcriptional regulator with XRE-family HTH domain